MSPAIPRVALATTALLAALVGAELGFAQIEMSLYGGLYVPTADVGVDESFSGFPGRSDRIGWRHATSGAVGGRLTFWLSRRFGVEATAQYSPSDVALDPLLPFLLPSRLDGRVVTATGRAVWRFTDPDRPVGYHVLGGLGLVTRSGQVFETMEGTTDFTFVVGVGLRANLGPRLDLRLDAENYAYWSHFVIVGPTRQFEDGTTETVRTDLGNRFVNDLVFSLGLAFRL
jgi:hypothetical protein